MQDESRGVALPAELSQQIKSRFHHVDHDFMGRKRLVVIKEKKARNGLLSVHDQKPQDILTDAHVFNRGRAVLEIDLRRRVEKSP